MARVALLGPIAWWWTCWGSPEHETYVNHRQLLHDALVDAGHLVYSPHNAWKGAWDANLGDECAQAVNDVAIQACDVALNMTPFSIPSPGTMHELELCAAEKKLVLYAAPGLDVSALIDAIWLLT